MLPSRLHINRKLKSETEPTLKRRHSDMGWQYPRGQPNSCLTCVSYFVSCCFLSCWFLNSVALGPGRNSGPRKEPLSCLESLREVHVHSWPQMGAVHSKVYCFWPRSVLSTRCYWGSKIFLVVLFSENEHIWDPSDFVFLLVPFPSVRWD